MRRWDPTDKTSLEGKTSEQKIPRNPVPVVSGDDYYQLSTQHAASIRRSSLRSNLLKRHIFDFSLFCSFIRKEILIQKVHLFSLIFNLALSASHVITHLYLGIRRLDTLSLDELLFVPFETWG